MMTSTATDTPHPKAMAMRCIHLAIAAMCAMPVHAWAHAFGNVGIDHYIRLTPQKDRLKAEFDEHFGELLSAVIVARLDKDHDGFPDAAAMADYLGKVRETLPARFSVTFTNQTHRSDARPYAPTNLDEAVTAYLADGEAGQKTFRTKWTLHAPWPDWTTNATTPVTVRFHAEFGQQQNMSQIVVGTPESPWVLLAADVPSDRDIPPPPDITLPIDNTNAIPIVRDATLLLGSGSLEATAPSDLRQGAEPTTAPAARPRPRNDEGAAEGRLRQRVFDLFKPPLSRVSWALAIALCLGWGAMHAFAPGHGKTIVSAYLIGMRAKWTDAVLIGATVTFTHTAVVFVVAVAAYLLKDRFVYPQWLAPLGAVIILLVGVNQIRLGLSRLLSRRFAGHAHHHEHPHTHGHGHVHPHRHDEPGASLSAGSRNPVANRDILALGLSGGLVPCPAAIIMLLMAWQLGQPALGLACLASFSLGLAAALMGVGILAVAGTALIVRWLAHGGGEPHRQHAMSAMLPILGGLVLIACGVVMLSR